MTITINKGGVPQSKALLKPVTIRVLRSCGEPGSDRFAPTFKKGDIVTMPMGRARELVRYHQATYTDESPTVDLEELEAASADRRATEGRKSHAEQLAVEAQRAKEAADKAAEVEAQLTASREASAKKTAEKEAERAPEKAKREAAKKAAGK